MTDNDPDTTQDTTQASTQASTQNEQDARHDDNRDSQDGTDTPVTEWFGQSVDADAELAEELVDEHGEEKAEELFDEQAKGDEVEQARRGDDIDAELGEEAYKNPAPERAAD